MVQWFIRPENALKRAEELLEVGRSEDALETLHDVIKSKRHRQQWTMTHEAIIKKHLELCVELKKPLLAKDALWQYRNIVQTINVKSLEDVLTFYLGMAEKKAEEARAESQGTLEEIDDLDVAESPETLLLGAVTGAGKKDRADRSILSPWLRFLWESYRQCLELLRNNSQVETLYHKVARQAFTFCKNYQRRAEFRKLCENLRQHLTQLQRSQQFSYSIKLSNPDTVAMLQDTRLFQMDVAIQMELWQEAYKSGEDVHQINQWGGDKRALKPQAVANYYEKLALIFWKSGNRLFHAAALIRLFQHMRDMKKTFGGEEASHLATRLVLATLTIPQSAGSPSQLARHLDVEELTVANQVKLTKLLELKSPPTRASMIRDISGRFNILAAAHPCANKLYRCVDGGRKSRSLDEELRPLRMAGMIGEEMENVKNLGKEEYLQYLDPIKEVAAIRILQQVSQMYETIKFDKILKMIPFFDRIELERMVVQAAKKYLLQVRVDQRGSSLEFNVKEGFLENRGDEDKNKMASIGSPGGVKAMDDDMSSQLKRLYTALDDATQLLDGDSRLDRFYSMLNNKRQIYMFHRKTDNQHIMERKRRIEQYKEASELQKQQHLEIEKRKADMEAEERRLKELEVLAQEQREYEVQQKKEREMNLKRQMVQDKLNTLQKSKIGQMVIASIDQEAIGDMEPEELIQKQVQQMEKERKDHHAKLVSQDKKWDHLIRAMHVEEIPFRKAQYEEEKPKLLADHNKFEEERVQKAKDERAFKIATFERLSRVKAEAASFLETVRDSRSEDLQKRIVEWEQRVKDERAKRLRKLKDERKKQRRDKWLQEQAEAKHRQEMEEKARLDQERKPQRGRRDDDKPKDEQEGRSDESSNWRQGPAPVPIRPQRDRPMMDRSRGPEREPGEEPPSERSSWRREMPPPRPSDAPSMGIDRGREIEPVEEEPANWRDRAGPPQPPPGRPLDEDKPTTGRYQPPIPRDASPDRAGYPPQRDVYRPPADRDEGMRKPERDEPRWGDRARQPPPMDDRRGPPMENAPAGVADRRGMMGDPRDDRRDMRGGPPPPSRADEESSWRRGPPEPRQGSGGGAPPGGGAPDRDMRGPPERDMRGGPGAYRPPRGSGRADGERGWRDEEPPPPAYEDREGPRQDRYIPRGGPVDRRMERGGGGYGSPMEERGEEREAWRRGPPMADRRREDDMRGPPRQPPPDSEGGWHEVRPRRGAGNPDDVDDWRRGGGGRDEGRGYPPQQGYNRGGPPPDAPGGRFERPPDSRGGYNRPRGGGGYRRDE